jgi:hypothetical protein
MFGKQVPALLAVGPPSINVKIAIDRGDVDGRKIKITLLKLVSFLFFWNKRYEGGPIKIDVDGREGDLRIYFHVEMLSL